MIQALAEELHEFPDYAVFAQHFNDQQDQVGGGGAFRQFAVQFESDHLWNQHGDRLTEHGGLGLDAANTPAQYAQAVDHGGV